MAMKKHDSAYVSSNKVKYNLGTHYPINSVQSGTVIGLDCFSRYIFSIEKVARSKENLTFNAHLWRPPF